MKVLWFSLSPCGSMRRNNESRPIQGWMISLEDTLKQQKGIELEVAFFCDKYEAPFTYDGVKYYPMYAKRGKGIISKFIESYRDVTVRDKQAKSIMLDVVSQSKPDLIHIHGTEECFGIISEDIKDIPICYSLQGLLAPITERYFSGYTEEQINRYRGIYAKLRGTTATSDHKKMKKKAVREVGFIKNAKYIMGRTEWDRSICAMINPNAKYFVINEILRAPFYKRKWEKECFGAPLKLLTVLSPGQIYKGYETLLKAAMLLKEHYNKDFIWYVAGYTNDNWLADIGHKLHGIMTQDCNINLCGIVTAEELAEMLANVDIYVQTSHIENSPNSLCEAMLVGTPTIATNVGGTESLLSNTGKLIPDGDPYIMAASIIEVSKNYELATSYSLKGHDVAKERHSKETIISCIINTYSYIINDFGVLKQ